MSNEFAGRVAIVTGTRAGLGRRHVLGLAAEGTRVALFDLVALQGVVDEIHAAGGEAVSIACDVADMAAVERGVA